MRHMFHRASSFNQLITMETSEVTDMDYMFYEALSFNQPITMDTSKVTNMSCMFDGATAMIYSVPSLKESAGEKKERLSQDAAAVSN